MKNIIDEFNGTYKISKFIDKLRQNILSGYFFAHL